MIDLRKLMLVLLERQKEYVLEDLENYSCAMVVTITPDGNLVGFPKFEGEEAKIAVYTNVVNAAKAKNATAIITLNHAFARSANAPDEPEITYRGELNENNANRCIVVTASGPGMKTFAWELGYEIAEGKVQFREVVEFDRSALNLLPGWAEDLAGRPV